MWAKKHIVIIPSKNGNSKIGLNPKAMFNKPHLYYFNEGAVYYECQHLYITSDEEIKEGDWFYDFDLEGISKLKRLCQTLSTWKKIIATTDTSLKLPLISQQFINVFIEQYNKGTVIKEVEVEYRRWTEFSGNHSITPTIDILIVNSDNTINIKQVKDSWDRKEVIELLHKYENDMTYFGRDSYYKGCFPKVTDDWANENL